MSLKSVKTLTAAQIAKKLSKMEKSKISEEIATGGVRGLGNVTGDPAVDGVNSYADTNAMSYEDENGNKLAWIKKVTDGHNIVGFKEFNPTDLTKTTKEKLKEGISAGPERVSDYNIGDPSGGRTLMRPLDVKEGAKMDKAKRIAAAGMTAANLYTLGDVTSRAVEGNRRVSAKHDIVKAASALPGPAGYAASAINYAKQAYDKVKHMKEEKNDLKGSCWKGYTAKGLKKKGGRMVPNCVPVDEHSSPGNAGRYTERPMYEKNNNNIPAGEVERGIYEGNKQNKLKKRDWQDPKKRPKETPTWDPRDTLSGVRRGRKVAAEGYASIGRPFDWAGDVNPKAEFHGKKPKATTTKKDEKDDTYKGSKQGGKVKFAKTVKEEQIDELKAETLGSYLPKAAKSRKKALKGPKADIKTWGKRQKGIATAIKKLTTVEDANKPDVELQAKSYSGATGLTHTIHEETKMDKEYIQEAINNIVDENLIDMKENFLAAIQEKVNERLEERKKEIAANYFAQD